MPEAPTQDINYQPKVAPFTFQKPFLKLEQSLISIFKLLLILIIFLIGTLALVISLNYFNILPLSQNYPDYFFSLPHQLSASQKVINTQVLTKASYYKESNSWIIDAQIYNISNDIVYFKYKNKVISLARNDNTTCLVKGDIIQTNSGSETDLQFSKCSDILSNANKGKSGVLEYIYDKTGNFVILNFQLD